MSIHEMCKKPEEGPFKVSYEYEPTPDAEERLARIYEFLLGDEKRNIAKNNTLIIGGGLFRVHGY